MTGVNEERRTELVAQYDAIAERYQAVDGVECTVDNTDGVYSMTVVIDVKDDVISQLSEQNLLTINGGASEISLEKSGTSLWKAAIRWWKTKAARHKSRYSIRAACRDSGRLF